jgi:hypothetical protein
MSGSLHEYDSTKTDPAETSGEDNNESGDDDRNGQADDTDTDTQNSSGGSGIGPENEDSIVADDHTKGTDTIGVTVDGKLATYGRSD